MIPSRSLGYTIYEYDGMHGIEMDCIVHTNPNGRIDLSTNVFQSPAYLPIDKFQASRHEPPSHRPANLQNSANASRGIKSQALASLLLLFFKRHPHQRRVSLLPNRLSSPSSHSTKGKGEIRSNLQNTRHLFSSSGKLPVRAYHDTHGCTWHQKSSPLPLLCIGLRLWEPVRRSCMPSGMITLVQYAAYPGKSLEIVHDNG